MSLHKQAQQHFLEFLICLVRARKSIQDVISPLAAQWGPCIRGLGVGCSSSGKFPETLNSNYKAEIISEPINCPVA